jgi:hypothetical protein
MLQRVPKKAYLFYVFEFESYECRTIKKDRKCVSKSRTGALVAKSKPMRDTFAPVHSRESFLEC